MTLGERIQEYRKEAGLSQEALGETLGVTRQSISKWESDGAIPELDKLIAMSKLFHISVGALLGVEEGQAPDRELTDRELAALSAIAEKLTPPAPEPSKKKRWPRAVAAVAALALVFWGVGFSSRMSSLENRLQNVQYNMNNIDSNVSRQISSIAGQVKDILDEQNKVTADMGYEVAAADIAAGTVTFRLWAIPRTHQEGMTAQFTASPTGETGGYRYTVIDAAGEQQAAQLTHSDREAVTFDPVTVQATEGEGHCYEATLTCPLADGISLSVTFRSGGESQNQVLGRETDLALWTMPQFYVGGGLFFADIPVKQEVPTLTLHSLDVHVEPGYHPADKTEILPAAVTIRLWRGEEVLWSQAVAQKELAAGGHVDVPCDIQLPLQNLKVGERFYLSAQDTDSAGRQYEQCLDEGVVEVGRSSTMNGVTTIHEYDLTSANMDSGEGYPWEK